MAGSFSINSSRILSAPITIVRYLNILNSFPFFPIRFCVKKIGPLSPSLRFLIKTKIVNGINNNKPHSPAQTSIIRFNAYDKQCFKPREFDIIKIPSKSSTIVSNVTKPFTCGKYLITATLFLKTSNTAFKSSLSISGIAINTVSISFSLITEQIESKSNVLFTSTICFC